VTLIRKRVSSEEWKPIGVDSLEDNAMDVVRSTDNRSVIAGPGSGKTELLAQRAAYLLQTGIAKSPRRILAISFKRDAAYNLAARVRSRCHPDQANRFDSQTFDACAKGLIDRFGQALPGHYRPTPDYEIAEANDRTFREFLQPLTPPAAVGTRADIMAISVKSFERRWLFGSPLAENGPQNPSPGEWAAEEFWRTWLRGGAKSYLTFPMIGRLAGLLIRTNPMVREALRLTYSHLFMDEFQDTTQVQYDLAKEIFLGSGTVVTAVGDNKQQIMRWAMAMDDAFAAYEKDFKAKRTPLLNNYRSSPDLVRIQSILAKALDAKATEPVSKTKGTISGDSCAVWDFTTPEAEADNLATFFVKEMAEQKLKPRDFAVLVRQKPWNYMAVLEPRFAKRGLHLRNEALKVGAVALQELLAEDLSEQLLSLLRLFTSTRAGRHWTACLDMVCWLRGLATDDDAGRDRAMKELNEAARKFREAHPDPAKDEANAKAIVGSLIGFLKKTNILAVCPAYRQGDWFDNVAASAAAHLAASCKSAKNWQDALDTYEGVHSVPLMTIHKSKGLEYHTIIFVGLDDGAWWSFANDEYEATAGFFVAFTRAKQRVIFSYCPARGARKQIAALYNF
jgi:superfamily I DNA/RNA helicase